MLYLKVIQIAILKFGQTWEVIVIFLLDTTTPPSPSLFEYQVCFLWCR